MSNNQYFIYKLKKKLNKIKLPKKNQANDNTTSHAALIEVIN